jgi:CHASE3 domain sensor protein
MTESTFRKLLLRLAWIPLLSLTAFLAILGSELRQIASARFAGAEATNLLLQIDSLQKSMIDEETGIRGYLAAKNVLFLQPCAEASGRFKGEFSSLKGLASANPALNIRIADISASYQRFNNVNQLLLKSNLKKDADVELLKQQKQAMDTLRSEFAEFTAEQRSIRESNRRRLTHIFDSLPVVGLGGGISIAILLLWYGNALFRDDFTKHRRCCDRL